MKDVNFIEIEFIILTFYATNDCTNYIFFLKLASLEKAKIYMYIQFSPVCLETLSV